MSHRWWDWRCRCGHGREVTAFAHDDSGVGIAPSDGSVLRADYLAGCNGGRSLIRTAAGSAFPGRDPTRSSLIAGVELADAPAWGGRRAAFGDPFLERDGGG